MEQANPQGSLETPSEKYYRELLRKNLLRLILTYLLPLILLTLYFCLLYNAVSRESRRLHLRTIAEHQSNFLDLFLQERIINLANLIDDPKLPFPITSSAMAGLLDRLVKSSNTFIDVGFFDSTGIQKAYAGPLPHLENKNYSHETWFIALQAGKDDHIITDVYLGLRQKPHFTIAVRRILEGRYAVLRATLDPQKFYEYINSLQVSNEVNLAIISRTGVFQVGPPPMDPPFEPAALVPPLDPRIGEITLPRSMGSVSYAYAWLHTADWAVTVRWVHQHTTWPFFGSILSLIIISIALIMIVLSIIIFRSKKLVQLQIEREIATMQFEHAAKLASVGELSAGIAHEINNPLAIISEEVGLMKDLMSPEFNMQPTFSELVPHLDNIKEAVFRCRDITRKLLTFVRKNDIKLQPYDINTLLDQVLDGLLIRELATSNIEIVKNYGSDLPPIITDANQITQVFLNILNNAADAITPPGKIAVSTFCLNGTIRIAISDTGKGITREEMGRIFMPFYTTKEVGKGTGLGLSVSYSIIKSLGGKIEIESIPGKGSIFTVALPIKFAEGE